MERSSGGGPPGSCSWANAQAAISAPTSRSAPLVARERSGEPDEPVRVKAEARRVLAGDRETGLRRRLRRDRKWAIPIASDAPILGLGARAHSRKARVPTSRRRGLYSPCRLTRPFRLRLSHKPSGSSTFCASTTKRRFRREPFRSRRVRFGRLRRSCEVGEKCRCHFRTAALVCATASFDRKRQPMKSKDGKASVGFRSCRCFRLRAYSAFAMAVPSLLERAGAQICSATLMSAQFVGTDALLAAKPVSRELARASVARRRSAPPTHPGHSIQGKCPALPNTVSDARGERSTVARDA
jgi:hypothetical protein